MRSRLRWLLGVGGFCVALAIAYQTFFLAAFKSIWTDRKVHVLGLGDSVTAGLGADTNLSQSGSTSLQHQQIITERLAVYPDDVFGLVLMTTGGNDLIHSYGRRPPREGAMYGATLEQARPWIALPAILA